MERLEEIYKLALQDLINHEIVMFGKELALIRVSKIKGLEVNSKGELIRITGDSLKVIQSFISRYSELSGLIGQNTVRKLVEKYPNLPISSS